MITFIISYDQIERRIDANFCQDLNDLELSQREEDAIDIARIQFNQKSQDFLYEQVNHLLFSKIEYICQNILKQVERQTGVEIELDVSNLKM